MKKTASSLALAVSLSACSFQVPAPVEDKPQAADADAKGNAAGTADATELTKAEVRNITYKRETHSVELELFYGGCGEIKHSVADNMICQESFPPTCLVELRWPKQGDVTCDAAITSKFEYALDKNLSIGNFTVITAKGRKNVFVDLAGKGNPLDSLNPGTQIPAPEPGPAPKDIPSAAQIAELSYDAQKHAIVAVLTYGGCAEAKHSLVFGEVCAKSFPQQCSATLVHNPDFNGSCKKAIQETMTFVLPADYNNTVLTVQNKDGQGKKVLIEKR